MCIKSVRLCICFALIYNNIRRFHYMKHKTNKAKKVLAAALATVCAVSSMSLISASATSSTSNSVYLKNGYTQSMYFNFTSGSGKLDLDITNGGLCSLRTTITAVEYNKNGKFVRNLYATKKSDTKNQTCKVSRKSSSNRIKTYVGQGTNYSSKAKKAASGTKYFNSVAYNSNQITTKVINP